MADTINSHGRGASISDAAQRGSTRAPMEEAMPVSPQGAMDTTIPDAMVHRDHASPMEKADK